MPKDMHYQMIHLGYSKFFNVDDQSTWCIGQTLGKIPLSGLNPPKLMFDLRNKLNKLTDYWNTILHAYLLGYVQNRLNKGTAPDGWLLTRLWYANYDKSDEYSFKDHRFCVPGFEEPRFQDPRTWLFGVWGDQKDAEVSADHFANIDAASCASDPKYNSDDAFAWDCDMAVYYADPTTDHNVTTIMADEFTAPSTRRQAASKWSRTTSSPTSRRYAKFLQSMNASPPLDQISKISPPSRRAIRQVYVLQLLALLLPLWEAPLPLRMPRR
jgi:hypothetical protein